MADTFVPPTPPSVSSSVDETPRYLETHFAGDAFATAADGINASPVSWSLEWRLTIAQADTVLTFLRAHIGKAFNWTMPRETSARAWEATGWSRTSSEYCDTIKATFEERFI